MSYFKRYSTKLDFRIKRAANTVGLRECQVGAFWATLAHFTCSEEPALIVMPTGSGKTAVMMMLAFGLQASRVLVVAPEVILRGQTYEKFSVLEDLVKANAFPRNVRKPKVLEHEGRIIARKTWLSFSEYDVVVLTPHTSSGKYHAGIVRPPRDLFDVVFFDEAHHARAPSWDLLLKHFSNSRCILLTATPFRLDRRKLPGRIVYHYPIGKAIDAGIYRPIDYHAVPSQGSISTDVLLCRRAKQILRQERKRSKRAKLLIRADRVYKCKHLIRLYKQNGMDLDEVNYRRKLSENRKVLIKLKQDHLDGVVCVGMLGEGLDIPELRIAVLHDPPKSFPFTIQFVGRISRQSRREIGRSHVIANPDQIRAKKIGEELRRIYRRDATWSRFVPKLVAEVIGLLIRQDQWRGPFPAASPFNPAEIMPFFSARLYEVPEKNLDLDKEIKLGENLKVYPIHKIDSDFRGLITERICTPSWGTRLFLESIVYDLHLYYYYRPTKTLFEMTTSDKIAATIRSAIAETGCRRLGGAELVRVMHSNRPADYMMVGLANTLGQCASLPSYKILMGDEVQGAVGPVDGRVFVPGHALARLSNSETRGIGNLQGRVWAARRASLVTYIDWCRQLGRQLLRHKNVTALREFPFLRSPQRAKKFTARPVVILFDPFHVNYQYSLLADRSQNRKFDVPILSPVMKIISHDQTHLKVAFYPSADSRDIELQYNLGMNTWQVIKRSAYRVKIDCGATVDVLNLSDFFVEYPPFIYLANGGAIINGELYAPSSTYGKIPEDCFIKDTDWRRCNIRKEVFDVRSGVKHTKGKKVILNWAEDQLVKTTGHSTIILRDHGSGEIADFVVIDPNDFRIEFCHCKASPTKQPGASIRHLEEALEQTLRTVAWIKTKKLMPEIIARTTGQVKRPNSALVKGSMRAVKELAKGFLPTTWNYSVCIIQPGLDCKKAVRNKNTNILLLTCFEWLRQADARLRIMGYCPLKSKS